ARNDFDIFADLAACLGLEHEFTDGRGQMDWVRHLYGQLAERVAAYDPAWPMDDFDAFWRDGRAEIPQTGSQQVLFSRFRRDPNGHPLATPSGKIEIFSPAIAASGAMPGH